MKSMLLARRLLLTAAGALALTAALHGPAAAACDPD
jgi:hypothetical protein